MIPKTAVIILCRYASTRLPGKILKEIEGKPILSHIIERIKAVFPLENIVVATSIDHSDQPIVSYCKNNSIQIFRGDLENVADRFLKAASSINAQYAIRINGDNLFVDIPLLNEFKDKLENSDFDFISNVKGRTYPKGMSIEAVKVDFYQNQIKHFIRESDFEHVTSFLYDNPPKNAYYFYNTIVPEAAGIQLAIDTIEDFEIASAIMSEMRNDPTLYKLKEIYNLYIKTSK